MFSLDSQTGKYHEDKDTQFLREMKTSRPFTSINPLTFVLLRYIRTFEENIIIIIMKHLHLILAGLLICTCCGLHAHKRVIERPPFIVRNNASIEVSKVVVSDTATVLHIYAKYRPKNWIQIAPESSLQDNNGERYPLRSGIGITPGKKFWMPESGEAEFRLVFPPLPDNATSIDFTEGEEVENGFSIWGIQLKGNKLPKQLLPPNATVHKADAKAELPQPTLQYGKAMLTGKLLDFRPGMKSSFRIIMQENRKGDVSVITPDINPDGSFSKEMTLLGTTPCTIYTDMGNSICFFMEPGKTTELYLNLRELARRSSKFRKEEKPYGEPAYINGPLQLVAQELNRYQPDESPMTGLFQNSAVFADKDIDSAKEYILKLSDQIQSDIDKLPCSTSTRQLLSINNRLETYSMLVSVPNLLASSAVQAKRITEKEAQDFYQQLQQNMPAEYIPYSDLALLNVPQSVLSSQYYNAAIRYIYKRDELAKAWGTDKGIFFDIARNISFYWNIKDFSPLTDAQKDTLATMPSAYREMLTAANDELLAQIEANKQKAGYVINQPDDNVDNEHLFASIIGRYKGKVLLVDFWATWCGPCRMANKAIAPMKEELKDEDIVYLYITGETSPLNTWKNMIPDIHGEHYRVTDGQWTYLKEQHKVKGVPTYLIVDREGNIKFRATGFPGVGKMKEELLKTIGEKEVRR